MHEHVARVEIAVNQGVRLGQRVDQLIFGLFDAFDALEGVSNRPKEVTLFIREDENGLFISVDDTGCGMTDEEKEKYLDQDFTTKGEGHGIGGRLIRNILKGI